MKKFILIFFALFLASCAKQSNYSEQNLSSTNKVSCSSFYEIKYLTGRKQLKGIVFAQSQIPVFSPINGIVEKIFVTDSDKVYKGQLLALIKPDFSNFAVKNQLIQKKYLQQQISLLNNMIVTTKNSFDTQINSLKQQQQSVLKQKAYLQQQVNNLSKSKILGVNQIQSQIDVLKKQIEINEKNIKILKEKEKNDLAKILVNLKNLGIQSKQQVNNAIYFVDKTFGISDKFKNSEKNYDSYLSAKNVSLKNQVKNDFVKYQKIPACNDYVSCKNFSVWLDNFVSYLNVAKQAIQNSLPSIFLPQTTISSWENSMNGLITSLLNLKNLIDTNLTSYESLKKSYENQVNNLKMQIVTSKLNSQNLEKNQISSYEKGVINQILQLSQQIENLNSTYKNLSYQIKNLQLQSKLQTDQLVNQLLTLNSNLKQIENSLSSYKVLSLVDGKIKSVLVAEGSKVSTSTPLIQILGKNTLKFKIFSPVLLSGNTLYFNFKGKKCFLIIKKMPYKDSITDNFVYESQPYFYCSGVKYDIGKYFSENDEIFFDYQYRLDGIWLKSDFIFVNLNGDFVKINGKLKKIILGKEGIYYVQVLSGLKIGDKVCK